MLNLIMTLIYIYLFTGFCCALIFTACLKYCNEYEVKDMINNSGLDYKETMELFKKANETYKKRPYTFFTICVLVSLPCLLKVAIDEFKGKKNK